MKWNTLMDANLFWMVTYDISYKMYPTLYNDFYINVCPTLRKLIDVGCGNQRKWRKMKPTAEIGNDLSRAIQYCINHCPRVLCDMHKNNVASKDIFHCTVDGLNIHVYCNALIVNLQRMSNVLTDELWHPKDSKLALSYFIYIRNIHSMFSEITFKKLPPHFTGDNGLIS